MADKSMREAYGDALLELADNETVVVLGVDLAKATSSINFVKNYPERLFGIGISEQNLTGAAVRIAVNGLKPYVSTLAVSAAGRAFEQVRNTICHAREGVRIVATHADLSLSADGGSHETTGDITLMRVPPGMTILSPCDYNQAKAMTKQMKDTKTLPYIRLSKHLVPTMTKPDVLLQIGVVDVLRDGADVCIAITDIMVARTYSAVEQLKERRTDAAVLSTRTIKSLDSGAILRYVGKHPPMVTVEEHSVIDSLGSVICEVTADSGLGRRVSRIGIQDKFDQSSDLQKLMSVYELAASHIVSRVIQLTER